MTILEKIVAFKKKEIADAKKNITLQSLVESPLYQRTPISLKASLTADNSTGIIAEYKRQSPSKGIINDHSTVAAVTEGYLAAGVAGQSILTDTHFFGGFMEDVRKARIYNPSKPILRKDFTVDAFQIHEAKAIGADVILLIATCLSSAELKEFGTIANDIGLEVLYEVHTQADLDKISDVDNKIIGINNRDLKTFKVDLEHSIRLASQLPSTAIRVSESGISDPETVVSLRQKGFHGFLIGENFMKTSNPGASCQAFINQIKKYEA